jgi:Stress responsive A/B Barrel Domain
MIDGTLSHQAYFWLHNAGSQTDRDMLIAGLQTLRGIPQIRTYQIGVPAPTEQRDVVDSSFDVSELMTFDSIADQVAYQTHPLHLAFIAACSHLWARVVVYDSLII